MTPRTGSKFREAARLRNSGAYEQFFAAGRRLDLLLGKVAKLEARLQHAQDGVAGDHADDVAL
jgi:hypothetical protein